ncbi:alpha/beta fold hydrolase [Cytobacillus firmus]|uniref:alpha/beta fold hydrolase n=1 Tax=Cytobacillus TaxID=2675230 RepID=UPI001D14012B|nr:MULTISPECIES: alpha/beta fold hydrolase [Cytobacillus]MCC3649417.1 alpha/beta fold hydrolase [Cytobacillus oceanisediminis]MCU1807543.1 alpha/beta fold hydrolase [Cytobacillus firmus]
MDAKRIDVNGTAISYYDEGKGEPLVLLHGFCGSKDYWARVIPILAENFRVIAMDLPGHEGSGLPEGEPSIEKMAEVIKGAMDELGLEKVSLFGHSLGGYVALAFAEAYEEKLKSFSLIHSTASPDSEEGKKGRDVAAGKIDKEGIESFIEGLVPKLFAPGEKHPDQIQMAKEIGYRTRAEGAKAALKAMKQRSGRSHVLKNTKLPVLIVAGEQDQIVPPEKSFAVKGSNINQVTIDNAGHMSMYEAPEELAEAIRGFLKE